MIDHDRTCVREFLADVLQIPPIHLSDDARLFSTGRLDSFRAVELILFLEQELGIDTSAPDFDVTLLDSVDEIMLTIRRH